jgi:hypothetical protein
MNNSPETQSRHFIDTTRKGQVHQFEKSIEADLSGYRITKQSVEVPTRKRANNECGICT